MPGETRKYAVLRLPPTMHHAHLDDAEAALKAALAVMDGSTPGEEAREAAVAKVREALSNHVPSVRERLP